MEKLEGAAGGKTGIRRSEVWVFPEEPLALMEVRRYLYFDPRVSPVSVQEEPVIVVRVE